MKTPEKGGLTSNVRLALSSWIAPLSLAKHFLFFFSFYCSKGSCLPIWCTEVIGWCWRWRRHFLSVYIMVWLFPWAFFFSNWTSVSNYVVFFFFNRCVEALTRAGQSDRQLLPKAVTMFEVWCYIFIFGESGLETNIFFFFFFFQEFLLYLNHVGLCTEEISDAGEGCGFYFILFFSERNFMTEFWFLFLFFSLGNAVQAFT